MKLVFLDIDGVLNSWSWADRRDGDPALGDMKTWGDYEHACHGIDPGAVDMLNRIIERTGAVVVVSSSWRVVEPLALIARALRFRGFKGSILGATPSGGRVRGGQILAWLDMLGERHQPDAFVILDDDDDMEPFMHALVLTDFKVGLTATDVDRAVAVLEQRDGGLADDVGRPAQEHGVRSDGEP